MAQDVFISHSARDNAVSDALCASLEKAGIQCWIAPRDVHPGRSFAGEITRAIQQSKVMVLVFSGHSNGSKQVLREVQLAVESDLHIIQFRIEDVRLNDDLTYFLSTPHWFDALTPPLEAHLPRLQKSIKELLNIPSATHRAQPEIAAAATEAIARSRTESAATAAAEPERNTRWIIPVAALILLAALAAYLVYGQKRAAPQPPPVVLTSPTPTPSVAPPTPTPEPVALVPTPSPTPVVASPSPSPTAIAAEPHRRPGILRNARPWRIWIGEFVRLFVRTNDMDDVELTASYYAPTVEVFEEGSKGPEAIRRDIVTYSDRWPTRRTNIRGEIQLKEVTSDREYTASFQQEFYVESIARREWIKGIVAVDLKIQIVDSTPRISSIKEKTLRRERGKL